MRWLTRPGWLMLVLGAFLCLGTNAVQAQGTTAVTSNFVENGASLPISASTEYFQPLWFSGDETRTAHHELLHAIGFSVAYTNFASHVQPEAGGQRQYTQNTNGTGTLLALLGPAAGGTHIDPAGGVVNGRNQNLSVMGPNNVDGQRMNDWERQILDNAFAWTGRNLKIAVTFVGAFTAAETAEVNGAVAAAHTLFGGGQGGAGHDFAWTVSVTNLPEPASVTLVALASGVFGAGQWVRRRRAR